MSMRTGPSQTRLTLGTSTIMVLAVAAACSASREPDPHDGASGESSSRSGSGGGAAGAAGNDAGGGPRAGAGAGAGAAAGAVGVGMAGRDDTMSNPDPPGDAAVLVDAGIDAATGSPSDAECLVAMRLTTCCPEYVPVTRAQLEADECLVQLPVGPTFGTDVTRPCRTISCVGVQCPADPPLSRIAVSDGEGGCRYGDECLTHEDCALGNATSGCCDCPRSMPVALFALNPCVQLQGEPYPTSDQCLGCTAPVQCGACAPPPEPRCSIRDTFSLCE